MRRPHMTLGPKGATGVMVRTLATIVERMARTDIKGNRQCSPSH